MLPALKLLLEIHFNQTLIVVCGILLSKYVFGTYAGQEENTNNTRKLANVYALGYLWIAATGAAVLVLPWPRFTVWACTAALLITSVFSRTGRINFNLLSIWQEYRRLCIYPFLIFLPFAIFLLGHFSAAEISSGIDPWALVERTKSYRVPDHYLQWTVSENLYARKKIETHFNQDGKQMWSAGDRPVLTGLLEATFSRFTKTRSISLYYLRIIFICSLLFSLLYGLLRDEFGIKSRLACILILCCLAIQPFFLINIIFTWPKMAGLSFGIAGFLLLSWALRTSSYKQAIVAGIAFSLGIICHTAALFTLFAAVLYFFSSWLLNYTKCNQPFRSFLKVSCSALAAAFCLTQIHSVLLSRVTNQTNLLARVQLCRGGSYAFVTPVESLYESCRRYYERVGISGIIDDRKESFRRAFNFNPSEKISHFLAVTQGQYKLGDFLQSFYTPLLLLVPDTIGHFSVWLTFTLIVLYFAGVKFTKFRFSNSSLLLPIGYILLAAFSCMLAEYTEMSSHVVPYVIPLFINLGILMELNRFSSLTFYLYAIIKIVFSCGILLSAGIIGIR